MLPTYASYVRAYARLPTAMFIFCCHKCHTLPFFVLLYWTSSRTFSPPLLPFRHWPTNDTLFSIKRHVVFNKTTRRFTSNITSFSLLFERIPHIFPNECYKDIANNCPIVFYDEPCDTCDSKKVKTPVVRARARTRESVFKICLRYNFLQKKIAVR